MNQINSLNTKNDEIKSKYEKQLKNNLDLKKQQDKILSKKGEKGKEEDKVKLLEFQLDQTLVSLDSVKED